MFFRTKTNIRASDQHRLKYFNMYFSVSIFMIFIYIIKYHFEYEVTDYTAVLSFFLLLFAFIPIEYNKNQNLKRSSWLLFIIGAIELVILVGAAGGTAAPGVLWLTALPLAGGILLKQRGVILGTLLFLLMTLGYHFLGLNSFQSTAIIKEIVEHGTYESERILNIVTFSIFNVFISYYFIATEMRLAENLSEQKKNTEILLRIVLHDIANQMTTIDFASKKVSTYIQDLDSNEKAKQCTGRLARATKEITSIITQIRQMNSMIDGKSELTLDKVNVTKAILEVIDLQTPLAEKKSITLKENFPAQETYIQSDAIILRNVVLANLLTNAIKFSNENSNIDIRVKDQSSNVVVEVQDYGMGMPEIIKENLFDFHTKTSRRGTNGETGTGYGMPLVKKYVDMMEGEIEIESSTEDTPERSRGTIMRLIFPKAA